MKLLVGLAVLAALLVGADLVAVRAAESAIAAQAQASGGLGQRPEVDVRGFPFLLQAVQGRYDDVRLTTSGTVEQTPVERLDVALEGVQVPLSDALSGDVARVPVDGLSGAVVLGYPYLSAQAPEGVSVSASGQRLRVQGQVRVLGRTFTAAALSDVRVDDAGRVVVRAREFETGSGLADGALRAAVGDRFDFRVDVPALPYGLRLSGVRVTPQGLALTAASGPTVLTR